MTCIVFEGSGQCVWCLQDYESHPYRWCRRCQGDGIQPDPTDREAQLNGLPSWLWRQHPCPCGGGIVTLAGQALSPEDRNRLESARRG
jgi:hypothetical protein